jgi:hypothetical protein
MEKVVPFFKKFTTIFYFTFLEIRKVLFEAVKVWKNLKIIRIPLKFKFESNSPTPITVSGSHPLVPRSLPRPVLRHATHAHWQRVATGHHRLLVGLRPHLPIPSLFSPHRRTPLKWPAATPTPSLFFLPVLRRRLQTTAQRPLALSLLLVKRWSPEKPPSPWAPPPPHRHRAGTVSPRPCRLA